ncbi:MAG: MFS transporter [Salaquimonas sp.]
MEQPDVMPKPKISKLGIFGWMSFDWAAQPFFTVVTTFIFGPYFVSRLADDPAVGQAVWAYAIAAAGVVIAILSPILGSISDQTGPRKPWIAFFAVIQIFCMAMLWTAAPGSNIYLIALYFVLATIAAEFSIVFNDSMLPRLVSKEGIGKVSNIAWGLGYLGGMITLIFVVAFMAGSAETGKTLLGFDPIFGLDPANAEGDRATGPLAAIWYLIFILPMFLFTPDMAKGMAIKKAVVAGLSELKSTIKEARQRPGVFRFLVSRMIYQDAVAALLGLGGAFAAGMFGWLTAEIGVYGIILNVVAIFGCMVAAYLDTRLGSKWVVIVSIMCLTLATVAIVSTGPGYTLFGLIQLPTEDSGGMFGTAAEKAYVMYGLLVGLAFGPVQASSRSWLARSVSIEDAGRYFGLYALSGRATSFVAPFLVATITAMTLSARTGMAVLIVFFLVGLYLAATTPYPANEPE